MIKYITGEIVYGGRITDTDDMKLCLALGDKFYFDPTVYQQDKYRFSESGLYYIPEVNTLEGYTSYVKSLPRDDYPEVFGLHPNAAIAKNNKVKNYLLTSLMSMEMGISDSKTKDDQD